MTGQMPVSNFENCLKYFQLCGFEKRFFFGETSIYSDNKRYFPNQIFCLKSRKVIQIINGAEKEVNLYGLITNEGEKGWVLDEEEGRQHILWMELAGQKKR